MLKENRINLYDIVILMLDLWLAKDNRFLNPKSSYERILLAPPCRLISLLIKSPLLISLSLACVYLVHKG